MYVFRFFICYAWLIKDHTGFALVNHIYFVCSWDTAGQERFRCIASSYYRGAHGNQLIFLNLAVFLLNLVAYLIYCILNNLDIKSKKLVHYSPIHLYLTYCINVWFSTYQINRKSLSTAQKKMHVSTLCYSPATSFNRYLYGSKYFTPIYINWLNYWKEYSLIRWTMTRNLLAR